MGCCCCNSGEYNSINDNENNKHVSADVPNEETINLLSYNIRLFQNKDIFKDSQHHRSTKIPSAITNLQLGKDSSGKNITGSDLDIIAHYELWTNALNKSNFKDNLIKHYKDNYKHTSQPNSHTLQNGDSIIFYHKNLYVTKEETYVYKHKEDASSLGSKGIVYLKFQKYQNSKIWYHLFATHTQDGHKTNTPSVKAKNKQMNEIADFVENMLQKYSEQNSKNAIILCGDFNTAQPSENSKLRGRDPCAWNILMKTWQPLNFGELNDYRNTTMTEFSTIRDKKERNTIRNTKKDNPNFNEAETRKDIEDKQNDIKHTTDKDAIIQDEKDITHDKTLLEALQTLQEDGPNWFCIDHIFYHKDNKYLKPSKCCKNIVLIQDENGYKIPQVVGKVNVSSQPKYNGTCVIKDLSDHHGLFATFIFKAKLYN